MVDVNEAGNLGPKFRGQVAQEEQQRDRIRAAGHGHGNPITRAEQASPADRARNAGSEWSQKVRALGPPKLVPVQGLEPRTLRI